MRGGSAISPSTMKPAPTPWGPPWLREPDALLRRLRRRLADAWWYEEPLEVIERLEAAIEGRGAQLAARSGKRRP